MRAYGGKIKSKKKGKGMAIFHLTTKNISRAKGGGSAVASAAYRSGEKLKDDRNNMTHDYTRKSGIIHSEIMTPENAPEWAKERETLWNEVELIEKRKDSRLAREIEVALPTELDRGQQLELVQGFVRENFISEGMAADIAIHDKGDGNPHAHIMLTTREMTPEGFGKKAKDDRSRTWNTTAKLEEWREAWEVSANVALERAGSPERIDRRTLEAQGIDRQPQIHVGKSPHREAMNAEIMRQNELQAALKRELEEINVRLPEVDQEIADMENAPEATQTPPVEKLVSRVINPPEKTNKGQIEASRTLSGEKRQQPSPPKTLAEVRAVLEKLEQERAKAVQELAQPGIEQLKKAASKQWEVLYGDYQATAERRQKLEQTPPEIGFMDKLTGRASEKQESWERSVEAMKKHEKKIAEDIERLKTGIEKQESDLITARAQEYDRLNPEKIDKIRHLRGEMSVMQEIASIEKSLEHNFRPGTAGFAGQVKGAKKLLDIETAAKRGLKHGFAERHPRAFEILKVNMERQREQQRGSPSR